MNKSFNTICLSFSTLSNWLVLISQRFVLYYIKHQTGYLAEKVFSICCLCPSLPNLYFLTKQPTSFSSQWLFVLILPRQLTNYHGRGTKNPVCWHKNCYERLLTRPATWFLLLHQRFCWLLMPSVNAE